MPKSLSLGNGSVLVLIDENAQIKDFYYDYVGLENQMEGGVNKVGVWVDGNYSWFDSGEWEFEIDYKKETMSGFTLAKNQRLEIELSITDTVYNEKNIFMRKVLVKNMANRKRDIKVYLNHQFCMYSMKRGDTVYFDPEDSTIVHYKGRRVALVGGNLGGRSFDDYTVGLIGIEGKAGTWKDAEDGLLSKNSVEHGRVDSTVSFEETVDANRDFVFTTWIVMGKTFQEAKDLHRYVIKRTPDYLMETTEDYWNAWVNKSEIDFGDLEPRIVEEFKKSLLVLRTHLDNTGAIIASGDSDLLKAGRDAYAYIWPRDAAYVVLALDRAGFHDSTKRFFAFANDVITAEGFFFHKYRCDRSWGSSWHPWIKDGVRQLPIQEDETALVIYALWEHYKLTKDLEFIENIYNSLIKRASNFMLGFRNELKLPYSTYGIWEEKFGTHTFTSCAVYAALKRSAKFAELLGKEKDEKYFSQAADEIKEGIINNLYNADENYFYKLIDLAEQDVLHDNTIDASSFYGVFNFDVLPVDDEKVLSSLETFEKRLSCPGDVGGFARYEGDKYFRSSENIPGNSWIITTLWHAQYKIKSAKSESDLKETLGALNWVVDRATKSGILSEQVNPYTGEQISAAPLVWSHAEYVITVILYLDKLNDLKKK